MTDTTPATAGTQLWQLDAVDLAGLIATGKVSAREATQSALARMDAVNPAINAVVKPLHDQALAAADAADARRAKGEALGPLHGVPVTIKVNTDQQGLASDNGIVAFKDLIATEDAPVVAHFKAAGAIVIGRSNTPGFSMRWFTGNDLHGETWNPWRRECTPGGSSGGAGAATAAGIGAIGQGNDIAGSVRFPSYCCGLVGIRPTLGRVPGFNSTATVPMALGAQFMAVQGPLARRIRDCRLAFEVMAQPHFRDPRVVPVGPFKPSGRPMRAAIVPDQSGLGTHPSIQAAIRSAGRALAAAGYEVEEIEPPELARADELWGPIAGPDVLAKLEPNVEKYGDEGIKKGLAFWRGYWPDRDPAVTLAALAERSRILRLWGEFFLKYPVIVLPTCTEPVFAYDEDRRDQEQGSRICRANRGMLAISALGLPGLAVPTGVHEGLPTGVQVVASPCREDLCFDAGAIIEAHHPMPTPIDPRP